MIPLILALALQAAPALPSSPDPMPAPRQPAPATPQLLPAPTADPAIVTRYRTCTEQVRGNAEAAVQTATAWRGEGGGVHANACLGLAYAALERWAPAATAFEQAARAAESAQDPRRADFWVQAGNAWLAAGDNAKALQAFDSALLTTTLSQELRGEVHLDRARVRVAENNAAAARTEIDRALQLVPTDPMAWYLSAALARRERNLARAGTDIARAREFAPDNPDVLLLAGTLAGLGGNMEEAERLYRRVAEGAPDSDAGRQARESLATMREIEVPAPAAVPTPAPPPPQPR
ncbi:MAG TPA: tetratricopeptide repeat protein [Allosphingosinicella sp.]|nr:tetratricopeptide repeat protein [Allosphingosinicella sp.]